MPVAQRKVVLGIGNLLRTDEGVGIHALKALEEELGPAAGMEFVDGGTLGLSLLPLVEACSRLLILDAVDAGQPPGTLIELERSEILLYAGIRLSQHQITFQEVLGLANVRGKLPEQLHLVGVQPADLSIGIGLSPSVDAVIPQVLKRATSLLRTD